MGKIDTSVIILNWNGSGYIEKCVNSVLNQTYKNFEILFVDNKSSDDSLRFVEKRVAGCSKLKIIKNNRNLGFAEGNNIGIRYALKNKHIRYIVTLNNDTIVQKSWLKELVTALKATKSDAACSKSITPTGKLDSIGGVLSKNGIYYERKSMNDNMSLISGCSCIYTRELLEDIRINDEYFDKDFFCYYEDIDLGTRAILKGYQFAFAKNSIVTHTGGVSSDSKFKIYHGQRNVVFFIIKTFPLITMLKYLPFLLLGQIVQVGYSMVRYKTLIPLKAKIDAILSIQTMLIKRKKIQKGMKISRIQFENNLMNRWFSSI